MSIPRRCVVLVVVAALAVPPFVSAPPAQAVPSPGLVMSVIRLARNRFVERPRAYRDAARNRDADLRVAADQMKVVETLRRSGYMPTDLYRQQQRRYADLRAGIKERAQREVKISKDAYDRAFGGELRALGVNALTSSLGVDTKAGRFVSQVAQGRDPLNAALSLIPDPKLSPFGQRLNELSTRYAEIQQNLQQARTALSYVRDPSKLPIQQELNRLLFESNLLVNQRNQVPDSDLERRMNELGNRAAALREAHANLRSAIAQLRPESANVNRQRFQKDAAWREFSATVKQAGSDLGNAPRAAVTAVNRANEQSVKDLLAAGRLNLSDTERARVLLAADVAWLRAARDARTQGLDPNGLDKAEILRRAVDAQLVKMGRNPLGTVPAVTATTTPPATTPPPASVATSTPPTTTPPPVTRPPTTVPVTTRPATTLAVTTTRPAVTVTTTAEQWVAWFATKIGFNPIYVSTRTQFDAAEKSCSYPGGGIDCTLPMEKTFMMGPYPSRKDAFSAVCASLSGYYTMGGIYAGMRMAVYQGKPHNIDNTPCPAT